MKFRDIEPLDPILAAQNGSAVIAPDFGVVGWAIVVADVNNLGMLVAASRSD